MLAYVFSHRPVDAADIGAYEDSLRRFHAELANAALPGFIESATFATDRYNDWYLLESTAAMEALNSAAVTGSRAAAHNAAARMAADGAGKLLSLASGKHSMDDGFEVRFGKPAGMKYEELYVALKKWTAGQGVSLWRRMMVLGPPPEFCLITPSSIQLPADMHPEVLRRRRI